MGESNDAKNTNNGVMMSEEERKARLAKKEAQIKKIKKYGTRFAVVGGIVGISVGIYFVAINNEQSRDLTTVGGIIRDRIIATTTQATTTVVTDAGEKTYDVIFNKGVGFEITSDKEISVRDASDATMNHISKEISISFSKEPDGYARSELVFPYYSTAGDSKKIKPGENNWYGISYATSPIANAKKSFLQQEKTDKVCINTEVNGEQTQVCNDVKKDAILLYTTSGCGRGIYLEEEGVTMSSSAENGVTTYKATVKYLYFLTSYNQGIKLGLSKV